MNVTSPDVQASCSSCGHPLADHRVAERVDPAACSIKCPVDKCHCVLVWKVEPELSPRLEELGALNPGTSLQTLEDAVGRAQVKHASDLARAFYNKILLKTAIRSVIWLLIARLVSYLFPTMSWIWYVVIVFIAIGIALAIWSIRMFWTVNSVTPRRR